MQRSRQHKNVWGPACLFTGLGLQIIALAIARLYAAGNDFDADMAWFLNFLGLAGFLFLAVGFFGALLAKRYSAAVALLSLLGLLGVSLVPLLVWDWPFRQAALVASGLATLVFWALPVPGAREGW